MPIGPISLLALNNLAICLSEVGQRQEALGPAQEAADLYRELAAKAPDAYRPDLAGALNNLANRLSEVGQRQEALGPAQEAADLYRELAAQAPDAYRPDLASALNNLANRLSEVGQRQEALGAGIGGRSGCWRRSFLALPEAYASWMMTMAPELPEAVRGGRSASPTGAAGAGRGGLAADAESWQQGFQLTGANE